MADFDQLKQKYQPVLDVIQKEGAQIEGPRHGWKPTLAESNG